ncbi:MAG: DNA glycosylase [Candidatus Bathyarchaeia archaeon]
MRISLNNFLPFSLENTLSCGQAFRWEKIDGWWYGAVKDRVFKIRQRGKTLEFENVKFNFVREYFRLEDNLEMILCEINKDKNVGKAVEALRGLRVLRQDPWECLISYICATFKNIKAIRRMLQNLSQKFGSPIFLDGYKFYTFPTPEKLAEANLKDLAACGLGYRAKYVFETSKEVFRQDFKIESLKNESFEKARAALLKFPGVGYKVADCVALFSLEKLEAFPVDVWIKRVLLKYYSEHFEEKFVRKISVKRSLTAFEYETLSLFGRKYFGKYAGYAQEYLYHFERAKSSRLGPPL